MRPGDVVQGRFALESVAGQGGMGIVFRATDRVTGRPVAVKVMTAHVAGAVARFDREATLLSTLDHPGIVRYVAHGAEQYEPWLAMEWLEGEELADRVFRQGITLADAITVVRHAAGAVGVAHQQGIVHRDLKPQNLFLVHGDPTKVKVLDFGIARQAFASGTLTQPGMVLGSPAYMAPEQASGKVEVGPTADVWSLGAVLFELVAGRPPFLGDLPVAILIKAIVEDAPRLSEVAPPRSPWACSCCACRRSWQRRDRGRGRDSQASRGRDKDNRTPANRASTSRCSRRCRCRGPSSPSAARAT